MGNSTQRPLTRFQDFEVDLEAGEVWKAGRRLKLQDQPFRVLAALLERPGQIVTREELRQLIWPEQSFGDFDHAINLAITKLRATLGDSAGVPHLIETLPRRGYRFIAPLKEPMDPSPAPFSAPPEDPPQAKEPPPSGRRRLWLIVAASVLILLCAVTLFRVFRARREQPAVAGEIGPLVSMPGLQYSPAVSPDGSQVAFAYGGAPNPGLYIAMVGGQKPLQLTENGGDQDPAWSPDGRQVAFVRFRNDGAQKSLYVIPALGGSERRLYTTASPIWSDCNAMDWSPDGKSLIFSESLESGTKARLSLLSLSDLTTRPLTNPRNQQFDCDPVFSPDGSTIAFASGPMGANPGDLFVLNLAGGQPSRLTTGNSGGHPAWTQDGTEIVYSSPAKGAQALWRISASGGAPQRVAGAAANVFVALDRARGELARL